MSKFLSTQLLKLVPYTPGEQISGSFIKLNTNESPFFPSPKVIDALNCEETKNLNLYSDPTAKKLVSSIANYYKLDNNNVIVGNGSDEILAFAFRAYGEKGFVCPSITYGFYPVFADFFSIELETVPMNDDLSINFDKLIQSDKNIVFANPNAQTGTYADKKTIEKILSSDPDRLVIIDEAYIDFGGESSVDLIDKYENLLVIQTFSKSRNLAGGRVGFGISNEEIINDLNTLRYSFNPYNVNRLSILAGSAAMDDVDYFKKCTKEIIETREWFYKEITDLGFECTKSKANFLLLKHKKINGKDLYLKLKEKLILVRYLGGDISEYVRITIGSKNQMETLLDKIKEILKEI